MNIEMTDIITILGALGGFEAVKWAVKTFLNRKTDARIEDAHADSEEFKTLREYNEFLQKQLQDKEARFVEQMERLRNTQTELFALEKEMSKLSIELALKRCEKKKCGDREPPNGY